MIEINPINKELKIIAFRAVENVNASQKYAEGHLSVLKTVGVTEVTSAKLDWMTNPDAYVVLVENLQGKVLGGARIHVQNFKRPLPIYSAVYPIDNSIEQYLESFSNLRVAELCGLWNSREVAGLGIGSVYLTRCSVALISQLNVDYLLGLAASYTLEMSLKVGYQIEESLGDKGRFYYPKSDLIAYALIMKDPYELKFASKEDREKIFGLRQNSIKKEIENGRKGDLILHYELQLF